MYVPFNCCAGKKTDLNSALNSALVRMPLMRSGFKGLFSTGRVRIKLMARLHFSVEFRFLHVFGTLGTDEARLVQMLGHQTREFRVVF